jgi:hypothetical protein
MSTFWRILVIVHFEAQRRPSHPHPRRGSSRPRVRAASAAEAAALQLTAAAPRVVSIAQNAWIS